MRIISGRFGGRRLTPPGNLPVRPTTDRAKEALFNILENRYNLEGLRALDLFAGTGNLSLELVSRGCAEVTAVDRSAACVQFIKRTAQELGAEASLRAIRSDVFRFLKQVSGSFDLIFADPPYDLHNFADIALTIFKKGILSPAGCLVIEHPTLVKLDHLPGFREKRTYGQSAFSFFDHE